jgi:hypothetical protein
MNRVTNNRYFQVQVPRRPLGDGNRAAMADFSGEAAGVTSQPTPSNQNGVAAPTVVRLDSPDHEPPGPSALGAVSGNAGTTPSTAKLTPQDHQDAVPKRVYKMKRTGTATLPQATPIRDPSEEPEPARVISDILPPQPFATPTPTSSAPAPKPHSASDATRKTKYATDEERRRATSIALKSMFTH